MLCSGKHRYCNNTLATSELIQTQSIEPVEPLTLDDIEKLIKSMKLKIKYMPSVHTPNDGIFLVPEICVEPIVLYNPAFWELKDDKLIRKEVILYNNT